MTRLSPVVAVAVAAMLSSACAPAGSQEADEAAMAASDPIADRAAFQAITDAWQAAAAAGGSDAMTALYTGDAIIQPGGEPAVRGREALAVYFANALREPFAITLSADSIVVSAAGDMAYETGTSFEGEGKYLVVYRRVGDRWLIAADSWSMNTPPEDAN